MKTIAVDIDDVLAASVEGWVKYSNEQWNAGLTVEDYDEDWAKAWGVDYEEAERRAGLLHKSGAFKDLRHFADAKPVLAHLAERYKLVITTSRIASVREETMAWLDTYYEGIFEEIHLAGFFDNADTERVAKVTPDALAMTKDTLLLTIGAEYLIDDQPKHCFAAAAAGLEAVLFGDYGWSRHLTLPPGVVRCKDWTAVGKFFDGQP